MFGEGIGSASINMVGNLLGTGIQQVMNARQAEKQNEFNLEMWNLQNAYNTPQAQMKRFEEAGLNPNLIYGQGTPGNATSAPQKHAAQPADWQHAFSGLGGFGEAFNIIGLKSALLQLDITNQHLKQEQLKTADMRDNYLAWFDLNNAFWDVPSQTWSWNQTLNRDDHGLYWIDSAGNKAYLEENDPNSVYATTWAKNTAHTRAKMMTSRQYGKNFLLPQRYAALGSGMERNSAYINYLAPQTKRLLFETVPWRMNVDWWNRQLNRGMDSLGKGVDSVFKLFKPKVGAMRGSTNSRVFYAPDGQAYYY